MNANYSYESVIIFNGNLDEKALDGQLSNIEKLIASHGGALSKKELHGKKELTYQMNKKKFGSFVELEFHGDNTLIADLERQLNINDNILRFLNVKKENNQF